MEPLYKIVHYEMVSNMRQYKGGPPKVDIKQKCLDYIEKLPFVGFPWKSYYCSFGDTGITRIAAMYFWASLTFIVLTTNLEENK